MSWLRPWVRFASTASAASSDLEVELARKWLKTLNANTVPRHLGEVSFSRSSGPGGQNVNKSVHFRVPAPISAGLTH